MLGIEYLLKQVRYDDYLNEVVNLNYCFIWNSKIYFLCLLTQRGCAV
mgnify:CR=1